MPHLKSRKSISSTSDTPSQGTDDEFYFHRVVRSKGLKVTSSRIEVLKILGKESSPISAEELRKRLRPHFDKSVMYRVLDKLTEINVVRRIDTSTHSLYELIFDRAHHHHITCTRCGDMEDVKDCSIQTMEPRISARMKKFDRITNHSLEFFGMCMKCSS